MEGFDDGVAVIRMRERHEIGADGSPVRAFDMQP